MEIKWHTLTFEIYHQWHLDKGIFGSLSSKTSHNPVFLSKLQYKISNFTRQPYAEGKGHAAGCYDNILPMLTLATSQIEGMPCTVCILHSKTLQETKYHLEIISECQRDIINIAH